MGILGLLFWFLSALDFRWLGASYCD